MAKREAINSSKIEINVLTEDDLADVAAVHIGSFPKSALTKMGPSIVQRYYLWQLIGPHKHVRAVGAFVEGDCAGFSFSGEFDGSLSGFIQNNKSFLVRQVLTRPWLLFNPLFVKRLYSGVNVLWRFRAKTQSAEKTLKKKALPFGILSIAVSVDYQGLGIGKILMIDAESTAEKLGFSQIELSVSPDNTSAVRFYERLNWKRIPPGADWNGYMTKQLQPNRTES